ncbi:hypothetical protein C4G66_RS24305 [Vibrio parahaemolyticus]|nr:MULTISPECIES: hypothetical protein [Vibrio harveyi group]ELH7496448.1 hypothetical protein [Vibrio vulnificus]EGQ8234465.1 hypothetical protein [Vibrio parahaemolyticus]EIU6865427.1 hypothetical protein [Vibrio parahaemolyticus]EIU7005290.1 hypothetical protein [Vibrio parahaemolyticus]EIU7066049.1 hypothetical protein [Vibrio parahaemolyticus]
MKWFKEDDGVVENALKIATALSLAFGVWAYFNTIHPVFEKEKELQQAKIENENLSKIRLSLSEQIETLGVQIKEYDSSIIKLQGQEANLKAVIAQNETKLASVTYKLGNAEKLAVLHKLNYFMDKMIHSYVLAITTGKKDSFDAVENAKMLLKTHSETQDPYSREAYEFFKNYVEKYDGKKVQGDDCIGFAVILPSLYKKANQL